MADRTLTVNGQPFTFNRDRFAGVRTMTVNGGTVTVDRTADSGGRTMTVTVDALPLTDSTTSIKVTVAGHSDLDGIYTGSASTDSAWSQQGGNGQIFTSGYNSESDTQQWFVHDSDDGDPTQGGTASWEGGLADRPWKNLNNSNVTITGIAGTETITVDRSSDRKGESRPLLSKVVGGAAAAYSLRDLNDKQGNNKVVRVRRSSDNSERDFLAKEVSNDTLKNWVNEIQTLGTVTNSTHFTGFTLTNASSTGFTATTDTATGVCGWSYTAKSGDKITVSFDAVVRAGTPQFIPRRDDGLSTSNLVDVVSDSAISINSTASYSFEFTYDNDRAGSLTFSEGDDNADFDISNFQVTAFKGSGFVETWYDQSGNSNDAVQATAANQPKVVNAGALIVDGQSKASIKFTASDTTSLVADNVAATQAYSAIFKANADKTGASQQIIDGDTSTTSFIQIGNDGVIDINNGSSVATSADLDSLPSDFILTAIINGSSTNAFLNGSNVAENQNVGSNNLVGLTIGKHRSSSANYYDNQLSEIIIYDSDQTANRSALEANINNQYDIY